MHKGILISRSIQFLILLLPVEDQLGDIRIEGQNIKQEDAESVSDEMIAKEKVLRWVVLKSTHYLIVPKSSSQDDSLK